MSIGYWYMNFTQTSDVEVIDLLQRAWQRESSTGIAPQENSDA
jgi:predicted phosphoribosyltransferase